MQNNANTNLGCIMLTGVEDIMCDKGEILVMTFDFCNLLEVVFSL